MAAPLRSQLWSQGSALGGALVSHLKSQLKEVKSRVRAAQADSAERVDAVSARAAALSAPSEAADAFDGAQWRSRALAHAPHGPVSAVRGGPPRPESEEVLELGQMIAARAEALARRRDTRGRAASAVRGVLAHFGLHAGSGHAYELAGELAKNPRFVEVDVARHHLQFLTAGAVVVWGRSVATRYGHVAIALGDGLEASDHVRRQTADGHFCNDFGRSRSRFARNYRVFLLADPPACAAV